MVDRSVEEQFHARVVEAVAECRKLGYNPTYFSQMVSEFGAVDTAKRLATAATVSDGFTRLWELGRLDLSVESLMLTPVFAELFLKHDLDQAARRLKAYET